MYAAIAEIILESEKNDYRFESFCRELCERHEGIPFVPTSQSWDRGRDARSTAPGRGSHRNLICCTLNEQIKAKVDADLLRITATSSPDRLVYCCSQKLSESKLDEISHIIRRHTPHGSVLPLGAIQLGAMAEKWPEIFDKHYHAEIQSIRSTILEDTGTRSSATHGLRLALIAFGSDEASELRNDLLYTSILSFFADGKRHDLREVTEIFSRDLGLPRPLQADLVLRTIRAKILHGALRVDGSGWIITDTGRKHAEAFPASAAAQLLKGSQLVRKQLESLIGKTIADKQYGMLWSAFVDFLGGLFYANGLAVIRAVDHFLTDTGESAGDEADLRTLLTDGVKRVVSVISTPDLRVTVERAILDIFTERSGEAFDWFTKIAERFVMLCSLGLEAKSSEEIRRALTSHQIVLDTDIILDYLCQAEFDHRRSSELLGRWVSIGGRILAAPVVLEEVAYHAWISDKDFKQTEYLLGKLKNYELTRYIKSAFVRTYHTLEKTPKRWSLYLDQFRGNSSGDYTKIQSLLRNRLKIESLPEAYDEFLCDEITRYLMDSASQEESGAERLEDISYKVERDGKLLASIAAARVSQEKIESGRPIVLLSSSRQLRRAESAFRESFGNEKLLLSIGALSYLLAMIPDSGLGADSLRRALFEFGRSAGLSDVARRAMRIIRATEAYDIPWGERGLLQQTLKAQMRTEAEKRGITFGKLRETMDSAEGPNVAAKLIVDSLTQMAIHDKNTEELGEARQKISRLEGKIADLEKNTRKEQKPRN